jgi:hypothetical protein
MESKIIAEVFPENAWYPVASWQRCACDSVVKSHAFQQFHRNERLTCELVNRIKGTDIGMVQGRSGTGLTLETF